MQKKQEHVAYTLNKEIPGSFAERGRLEAIRISMDTSQFVVCGS
jgi:hypothetical protein